MWYFLNVEILLAYNVEILRMDEAMSLLKKFKAVLYQPERNTQPITLYFDEIEIMARAKAKKMLNSYPCGSYLDLYDLTQKRRCVATYGKNMDGDLSEIHNRS